MPTRAILSIALLVLVLAPSAGAIDIERLSLIASCQKKIASAGARFSMQVIKETLKCTNEIAECQLQCEAGVFGPPCDSNPPPCCDPDDRNSNAAFGACMDDADEVCAGVDAKIAKHETSKQERITAGCIALTSEELCGSQGDGLNFATLNAGCLALDPSYTCTLPNLINCVGGPLQRQLTDQISGLLHGRAGDAVAALNLASVFPGLPIRRKVKEDVPQGKVDMWALSGQAGDLVRVTVMTRDDNGNDTSNLDPTLFLLDADDETPVADTNIRDVPCGIPSVCGGTCAQFDRYLPFSGTFHLAVRGAGNAGCIGGKYRLAVVSPGGAIPTLVADDVDPVTP
jgi:hypothetical protein